MTAPSDQRPGEQVTYVYLGLTALALLFVLFAPFSAVLGGGAVVPWYAANTGLTCLAAAVTWWRPRSGCFEMFIPFVATIELVAFTAARPSVIGPWIPVVHALALVALATGWRRRGRKSRNDVR